MEIENRYILTRQEVENNIFLKMPEFLFNGEFEGKITNNARVLFTLFWRRNNLSLENNWFDDDDKVYFMYSREDMCLHLSLSEGTIRKIIKELQDLKLLKEVRRGQGNPNIFYLLIPKVDKSDNVLYRNISKKTVTDEGESKSKLDNYAETENEEESECSSLHENHLDGMSKFEVLDPQNLRFKTSKNCGSRPSKIAVQDPQELRANKIDSSYIDSSYIERGRGDVLSRSQAEKNFDGGKKQHGMFGWVTLTDDEFARLCDKFGHPLVNEYISIVDLKANNTGNKYGWSGWESKIMQAIAEDWGNLSKKYSADDWGYLKSEKFKTVNICTIDEALKEKQAEKHLDDFERMERLLVEMRR